MKKILWLFLLVLPVSCNYQTHVSPTITSTGPGYVRNIDWYHRTITHETDGGFINQFHFCDGVIPVWEGEHVDIHFRWTWVEEPTNSGCNEVMGTTHIPPDAKGPK